MIMRTSMGVLSFVCILWQMQSAHAAAQHAHRVRDIPLPDGCVRTVAGEGSFEEWLRALPLRAENRIMGFDGKPITNPIYNVLAVIDMKLLFQRDLEQCADFAMRLWAEYHRTHNRLDDLFLFEYSGKKVRFRATKLGFESFLRRSFAYANSHSLKKGCAVVREEDVRVGDLIVQNERGGIGHVSVIMDVCTAKDGTRLFLIGFSFMPAQEFHIERAAADQGRAGWFTLAGYTRWLSANLDVGTPVLRRFAH